MKHNYLKNKRDLEKYVFKARVRDDTSSCQLGNKTHMASCSGSPRQTYHVEKINNRSFKIYKQTNDNLGFPQCFQKTDGNAFTSINLKVHFKKTPRVEERREFASLLRGYLRVRGSVNSMELGENLRWQVKGSRLRKK
jgi:hypothetical protein